MWSVGLNEAVEGRRAVGVIMRACVCVNVDAVCMRVVNERKEKGRKGGRKGEKGVVGEEKREDKKNSSEKPPAKIQSERWRRTEMNRIERKDHRGLEHERGGRWEGREEDGGVDRHQAQTDRGTRT